MEDFINFTFYESVGSIIKYEKAEMLTSELVMCTSSKMVGTDESDIHLYTCQRSITINIDT